MRQRHNCWNEYSMKINGGKNTWNGLLRKITAMLPSIEPIGRCGARTRHIRRNISNNSNYQHDSNNNWRPMHLHRNNHLNSFKIFFSILTFDFKQYQVKFTYWQGNNNNNCCCCCCNSTKQHWEQHWKRRTHAKNDRYFDGSTASGSTATLLFSPRLPTKATPAESPRASFCSLSLSLSVHRRR